MGELVAAFDRRDIGHPKRGRTDSFPELAQLLDAPFRRIAGDQCRVDGPDRNTRDPVRVQVGFGQSLIDAGLIGAERSTALQQQDDTLEGRPLRRHVRLSQKGSGQFDESRFARISGDLDAASQAARAR